MIKKTNIKTSKLCSGKKNGLLAILPIYAIIITILFAPKIYPQVYTNGYIGGMFGRANITKLSVKNIYNQTDLKADLFCLPSGPVESSVIGGLQLGLWGESKWSKHFGLYCDVSFNKLNYCHSFCHEQICYTQDCVQNCCGNSCCDNCTQNCTQDCLQSCTCNNFSTGYADINFSACGHSTTLAFMAAFRTCHFTSKAIPEGKLNAYLAIGPAAFFAKQCAKIIIGPHEVNDNHFALILKNSYTIAPKQTSKTSACLAIDAGLKQRLSETFALDYGFKYRFTPCKLSCCSCASRPNTSDSGATGSCTQNTCNNTCNTSSCTPTGQDKLAFKTRYNLFSFNFGLCCNF